MKKIVLALSMFVSVSVLGTNSAQAQVSTGEQLLAAAGNLVNVQVGSVNVAATDVIDVSNVLNNNTTTVTALNNIINGITIDNVLNNTLRDATLLNNNQVVVGVVVNALGAVQQVLVTKENMLKKK